MGPLSPIERRRACPRSSWYKCARQLSIPSRAMSSETDVILLYLKSSISYLAISFTVFLISIRQSGGPTLLYHTPHPPEAVLWTRIPELWTSRATLGPLSWPCRWVNCEMRGLIYGYPEKVITHVPLHQSEEGGLVTVNGMVYRGTAFNSRVW